MCPASTAVPRRAPGSAPGLHQPTIFGFSGMSSSSSDVVPTLTIGASADSFGISTRSGESCSDTALVWTGTNPTRPPGGAGAAYAPPRPQYGEVFQTIPETATSNNAPITQAKGTTPTRSSRVRGGLRAVAAISSRLTTGVPGGSGTVVRGARASARSGHASQVVGTEIRPG